MLLGDVVEFRHRPVGEALEAAVPVLQALGGALPGGAEVVLLAGNHDHHLIEAWQARSGRAPALENAVDWGPGEPLGTVIGALAPASARVAYPAVWLRQDVIAHHGHYGDRHTTVPMLERLAVGATARAVREAGGGPRTVADYERALAPVYAWIHAVAQAGARTGTGASAGAREVLIGGRTVGTGGGRLARARAGARRTALRAGFAGGVGLLNRAGVGPLRTDLSGPALRRAGLIAQAEVVRRLGGGAAHWVFGHTHRAGPLPGDVGAEWAGTDGARLWNSGCWVEEGGLLGAEPGRSPYRAGFAVELGHTGPPRVVNLLD